MDFQERSETFSRPDSRLKSKYIIVLNLRVHASQNTNDELLLV